MRHSTANLFADFGYGDAYADLLKAEFVRRIHRRIDARALTQVQAAKLMGVSQPACPACCGGISATSPPSG